MMANDIFGQYIRDVERILKEEIITALIELGKEGEAVARENHPNNWNDISGNLRSSVGYAVYEHGRIAAMSAFNVVLNGSVGAAKGTALANSLGSQLDDAYHLTLLAAMDYAERVEALSNRDVLASAELYVRNKIEAALQMAVSKAEKRCNALR